MSPEGFFSFVEEQGTCYESRFSGIAGLADSRYEEGLRFFRGEGMANETLRRLVADLEAHGIDYNVIGAVALNQHGYRRFTEEIYLLLSPEGLEKFQSELVGRGYRPAFPGATKKFCDTIHNILVGSPNFGRSDG